MARARKTATQFKQEVFELVGLDYSVLGEYTKGSEKILMKHELCGHEWCVRANNFLRGARCPKCSRCGKLRKTQEEFVDDVLSLVGNEYEVLGQYVGVADKIKMRHRVCAHEWYVMPNNFLQGTRCPKCARVRKK